ncbi:Tol-Pal system beta propeller repeat protein TolB [Methylovulum psychrotolerans]|uniref:Tol-Pal system protein TolB n=1 Tax=Methylovulum psychrotolerans TaxID=1704499 RepID=A0A1Z4BVJ9_9GAMM|nr:Tol-Pal system beta propeller repeat protein TolB [Methylovulum psychrotolerans]ASF45239.1 Tol-Pal system beta propeller repeat protein TolB [Methylovulum psychrotolerans]MBT9099833.1 Tol-Pal system beta propeller repeat protein TolB [Methylovulum psychrotolerans]
MTFLKNLALLALCSLSISTSYAALTIEVTGGTESALPVAVVPFAATAAPVDISSIVNADLERSGYFKMMAQQNMQSLPNSAAQVNYKEWQSLMQDYLVVGKVNNNGGQYDVQFQLLDVNKGGQMLGYKMSSSANDLRRTAHHISDLIFEKLTGKKSVFSGRIAYITSGGKQNHQLQVADADGFNPQTVASSREPLMSPAWSPDGKRLAYVSFERHSAAIYIQTLASGQRERVAEFPGINGAPSWSPDGTRLALTLSKDGSPDIFVLDLGSRSLTRLSKSTAIDTEPTWSPDGSAVVFTSDRGGKPQLYMVSSRGGDEKRITFSGDYNARASFSPDGRSLAMVHGGKGGYRIAVMDMASRSINVLTAGPSDESPSFAPNGTMILYASKKGGAGFLSAVSVDGKMQQKLQFTNGEVREPAWSPQ